MFSYIPIDSARHYGIVPLAIVEGALEVGIIDPDNTTNFNITAQSTDSTFYNAQNITVTQCLSGDVTAGCSDMITGYKITFANTPTTPGNTAITLNVKENGTMTPVGYTSFTLRVDPAGTLYPPSMGMLPNRAIRLPATVPYTTKFVIGDLDGTGTMEDIASIGTGNFMKTSSNSGVVDPSMITITQVPAAGWYAPLQGNRTYVLTAPTTGTPGVTTITVQLHDADPTPN